jgi:hypothetical protein
MAAMLGAPARPEGQGQEKRKKESILDLTKFLEKPVRVKFAGKFYLIEKGYDYGKLHGS